MSIRYGREDCEHLWTNRTDGIEDQCIAIVCLRCGAFGCGCDIDEGLKTNLAGLVGVGGDADPNGEWENPYVERKRLEKAVKEFGEAAGITMEEADIAFRKFFQELQEIQEREGEMAEETMAERHLDDMNRMNREEKIVYVLRELYPDGHPDFIPMMLKKIEMHSKKNKGYAQGGRPLGNFERSEAIKRLYPGFDWASAFGTAIDYLIKQFDCALWQYAGEYQDEVEDIPARLGDVSIYADLAIILIRAEMARKAKEAELVEMTDEVMENLYKVEG